MDKINFNQTGGLPLSTDVLNNMQEAYKVFNQFGNLFSKEATKNIIVAGCTIVGSTASEGFVLVDNELLPFAGGTVQEYVYIKNEAVRRSFKDGTEKEVETKRTVHFGTDPNGNGRKWGDFVALPDIKQIKQELVKLDDSTQKLNVNWKEGFAFLEQKIDVLNDGMADVSTSLHQADSKITSINDVLLKSKVIINEITSTENIVQNITINHGLNNSNIILYTVETKLEDNGFWQSHENKYLQRRDNNQIYVIGLEDITSMSVGGAVRCWIRVNIIYKAN